MNKRRRIASIPAGGKQDDASATDRTEHDRVLVARAKQGDRAAFRKLFERHQRRAYLLAYGVVHDPDEALDVVQDAFLKAHRNLANFEGTASFYTWLYRIVMNVAIDHVRKASRQQSVDYDDTIAHLEGSVPGEAAELMPSALGMNPGRELLRKEARGQIGEALAKLSVAHRTALVLREVDGLSYEEMAEAMDCSKGTVMSRLFYARRYMQKFLLELLGGKKDLEV